MKQTAIEWLQKELIKHGSGAVRTFGDLFEQAKEMEKQQIIDAHFSAQMEDLQFWDEAKQEALDYYNETFKSE